MTERNVSLLEEIAEQDQAFTSAGQGWTTTITSLTCYGVSWVAGNNGQVCTATVECQNNCN
ncbi:plantaricin C family lantibiotic [uncultured Microbacterium sp.]|uniref:plantaricin C family lantibiotic n=1 Tax=uncultured Microbacterium sp. TaxID=191216 RepID=UPI0028D1D0AF|nr:plantaricin C family lantibiotic [uncultured Microbacterium sp.]